MPKSKKITEWVVEHLGPPKSGVTMTVVNGLIKDGCQLDSGTFNPYMDGTLVEDYFEAIKAQVAEIKKKHLKATAFTIVDESNYDACPLQLKFLRPMNRDEKASYDSFKAHAIKVASDRIAKAEANEREQAIKLLKKYPDLAVNKQGTKTERISSKVKAKSNVPKRNPRRGLDHFLG